MHRINTNSALIVFLDKLTKPSHLYLTSFSQLNYTKPTHKLNRCKYRTSIRRPCIWNEYVTKKEKEIKLTSHFELAVKSKLLLSNNELSYFSEKKFFFLHKYKISIFKLSLAISTWFVAWDLMARLQRSFVNPIPFQENFV